MFVFNGNSNKGNYAEQIQNSNKFKIQNSEGKVFLKFKVQGQSKSNPKSVCKYECIICREREDLPL